MILKDLEAVKQYLEECIVYWRKQSMLGNPIADYYVDAYQSMRRSIYGEELEKDGKELS